MKRILYIGDFKALFSTERYIAYALKSLGYEVMAKQEDLFMVDNPQRVADYIKDYDPILVLFSKGRPQGYATRMIEILKLKEVNTACWLFDLYFNLPSNREAKLIAKQAPYNVETIFSTDGGSDASFKSIGIKHKLLRQGIHEPEAILLDREKTHEIIFVGGDYFHNRGDLLNGLKDRYGGKFEWLGKDGLLRNMALNEVYASTKIVVGDSQPSPHYWSNRIYETLGRGGFLIHPRVEGLETEFEDKKHLVLYERGNLEELYKLIDYYLEHEEEREVIRKAGFEHVKNNYTYKHRCIELMKHYI